MLNLTTMTTFRLAPMTRDVRLLTIIALALPVAFAGLAIAGPPQIRGAFLTSTALTGAICLATWLAFRPTHFVIDDEALQIRWPVRSRRIPRALIESAQIFERSEFVRANGSGTRIGVGGLWGTFGLLNADRQTFSIWVSRSDQFVLIRLREPHRPLLITPDHAPRFVATLDPAPRPK
jgi:hypothetical protein